MNIDHWRAPCVYLLKNMDAAAVYDYPLKNIALVKYGCTRSNLKARISSANRKYNTNFELVFAVELRQDQVFEVESKIRDRYDDAFGSRREFLVVAHDHMDQAVNIFMEEACAAG